jgi:predicted nucleic acid-binding protein
MGRKTELNDLIATVARARGDILVTHNPRDFINIPGWQLED